MWLADTMPEPASLSDPSESAMLSSPQSHHLAQKVTGVTRNFQKIRSVARTNQLTGSPGLAVAKDEPMLNPVLTVDGGHSGRIFFVNYCFQLQTELNSAAMQVIKSLLSVGLVATCTGCALKDNSSSTSQYAKGHETGSRNMYSPEIYSDGYAQQQWTTGIEALEAQCRTTGKYCLEAQQARKTLRGHTGGEVRSGR